MNVKLLVVQGKPEGKEIPLRIPKFLIGRGPECHLRPNSELISRHHCLFTLEANCVKLRDLGSTNGTVVNGERLTDEIVLQNDDMIQVGPLGFQVMIEQTAPVAAVAPVTVVAAPPAAVVAAIPPAVVAAVPAVVAAVPAAVAVAATASSAVASRKAAVSDVSKLGSSDAADTDIDQWLMSDGKRSLPDSGSGVFNGDTQLLNMKAGETTTDAPVPPGAVQVGDPAAVGDTKPADSEEAGDGPKQKNAGPKNKIEKTREDTSRAAADILRRMMERRPGK
jgi:pSer/pThr/pTyr-binding forkhead associated (FHA) protein